MRRGGGGRRRNYLASQEEEDEHQSFASELSSDLKIDPSDLAAAASFFLFRVIYHTILI